MASTDLPSFVTLQRRYGCNPAHAARQNEHAHLLTYLREHGASVTSADDVYHAIVTLNDEDELAAFRCREGIAVSHASDGWWLLLRNDEALTAPRDTPVGVDGC